MLLFKVLLLLGVSALGALVERFTQDVETILNIKTTNDTHDLPLQKRNILDNMFDNIVENGPKCESPSYYPAR